MAELDSRSPEGASVNSGPGAANAAPGRTDGAQGNHAPPGAAADPSSQAGGSAADDRSGLDRAEAVVDHLAGRISSLASRWGRKVLRMGSRTREAAQDFWAEVQDFRQGKKP